MSIAFDLFCLLICTTVFLLPVVYGCGQLPAGREKTVNFTLRNFKLPPIMTYSDDPAARIKAPTISTTKSDAETFVRSLIMQSVEDVLNEQGRSALLPDNVVSLILQQLGIEITYDPLKCDHVIDLMGAPAGGTMVNCIVTDGTIANICMGNANDACMNMAMVLANSKAIDSKHFSFSGSLKTSNVIMANWSNQMWESVFNRVLRRITSGQYGSFFYGASVTIR